MGDRIEKTPRRINILGKALLAGTLTLRGAFGVEADGKSILLI